ncbi:MAG TPA: tRNA pseudouridine(38-40) synthase TruA [Acidimicrobiia bacterium]
MPTYRLDFSYDGTGFHGFAAQPAVRTVQGELEEALSKVFRGPIETVAAGRTDAGVHARLQVVSFFAERAVAVSTVARAVTSMLGPEVVAHGAEEVPDDFSARFSARSRTYRYQILNGPVPDPLRRHTTWHVSHPLDLDAMNVAASAFVGEHDFAAFCRRRDGAGTERTVHEARWAADGDLVVFSIRAKAFCHQMVRSLAGFCVDVGRGAVDPSTVPAVLEAGDRSRSRQIAPPHGLILWDVEY